MQSLKVDFFIVAFHYFVPLLCFYSLGVFVRRKCTIWRRTPKSKYSKIYIWNIYKKNNEEYFKDNNNYDIKDDINNNNKQQQQQQQKYYHIFTQKELNSLFQSVRNLEVTEWYQLKGSWVYILTKSNILWGR